MEPKVVLTREELRRCLMVGVAIGLQIKGLYGLSDDQVQRVFMEYVSNDNSILSIIQQSHKSEPTWEEVKKQLGL